MGVLGDRVAKIRSKNAGPFWITIDIFCGTSANFDALCQQLSTDFVAQLYGVPAARLKRFDIPDLNVIKFSFPRPVPQGAPADRDLHGAQYAELLAEAPIE